MKETLPPELLINIINVLAWIIAGMISIAIAVFAFFHKSLLRRLDNIDNDIKPMAKEIAVNNQRLDEHERRILVLEEKIKK